MGWIEYREYYASKRVQRAGVLIEYRKRVCIEKHTGSDLASVGKRGNVSVAERSTEAVVCCT